MIKPIKRNPILTTIFLTAMVINPITYYFFPAYFTITYLSTLTLFSCYALYQIASSLVGWLWNDNAAKSYIHVDYDGPPNYIEATHTREVMSYDQQLNHRETIQHTRNEKLKDLENGSLCYQIYKDEFTKGEVVNEAIRRFKYGAMEGYEVTNLAYQAGMKDFELDRAAYHFSLKYDTREIRRYLFQLVPTITGTAPSYWSGTAIAKSKYFMQICKNVSYIDISDLDNHVFAQQQIIDNLGFLASNEYNKGYELQHLRAVAIAFLIVPRAIGKPNKTLIQEYEEEMELILENTRIGLASVR